MPNKLEVHVSQGGVHAGKVTVNIDGIPITGLLQKLVITVDALDPMPLVQLTFACPNLDVMLGTCKIQTVDQELVDPKH